MSQKIFSALLLIILIISISHASADASFTNELDVQGNSLDFLIREYYSGIDAEAFRTALDHDESGSVSIQEVEAFRREYSNNRTAQYLGYIIIDDGNVSLHQTCFEIDVSGADGPVGPSEMWVTVSIQYDLSSSVSSGKHRIWVLGHPLIERMTISLPEGVQLSEVDGIEELSQSQRGGKVFLEGRSGIRSFIVDGRQTFEYAVMINTYKSSFIADLSVFPSFF